MNDHSNELRRAEEARAARNAAEIAFAEALKALNRSITDHVEAEARLNAAMHGELYAVKQLVREVACNRAEWSGGPATLNNVVEYLTRSFAQRLLDARINRVQEA